MDCDATPRRGSPADEHVIVGGCYGLILLRREELAPFYAGHAWVAGAAFALALLDLAAWMATR